MTTNPVASWDFTLPVTDDRTPESVRVRFRKLFKKWTFQR